MPSVGSLRSTLVRGATAAFVGQGLGTVANLYLVRLVVRTFDDRYGVFLATSAILGWSTLLELGLGMFVAREIAGLTQRCEDHLGWRHLYHTCGVLFVAISIIVAALGTLGVPLVIAWLAPGVPYRDELLEALRLVAFQGGFFIFFLGFPISVLCGYQKLQTVALVQLLNSLVTASCTIILIRSGCCNQLKIIPLGAIAGGVASGAIGFWLIRLELREKAWCGFAFSSKLARAAFGYCWPFIPGRVFFFVKERTAEPIALRFLGAEAVVAFNVTARLVRLVSTILPTISNLLFSPAASLLAAGETLRLKKLVLIVTRGSLVFGITMAASVFWTNQAFVTVWVSPDHFGGQWLTFVFCVTILVDSVQRSLSSIVLAAGKTWDVTKYTLWEAICNIVLSLILIRIIGLSGLALAALLSMCVGSAQLIPRVVFRAAGIRSRDLKNAFSSRFIGRASGFIVIISAWGWLLDSVSPAFKIGAFTVVVIAIALPLFWEDFSALRGRAGSR